MLINIQMISLVHMFDDLFDSDSVYVNSWRPRISGWNKKPHCIHFFPLLEGFLGV